MCAVNRDVENQPPCAAQQPVANGGRSLLFSNVALALKWMKPEGITPVAFIQSDTLGAATRTDWSIFINLSGGNGNGVASCLRRNSRCVCQVQRSYIRHFGQPVPCFPVAFRLSRLLPNQLMKLRRIKTMTPKPTACHQSTRKSSRNCCRPQTGKRNRPPQIISRFVFVMCLGFIKILLAIRLDAVVVLLRPACLSRIQFEFISYLHVKKAPLS